MTLLLVLDSHHPSDADDPISVVIPGVAGIGRPDGHVGFTDVGQPRVRTGATVALQGVTAIASAGTVDVSASQHIGVVATASLSAPGMEAGSVSVRTVQNLEDELLIALSYMGDI